MTEQQHPLTDEIMERIAINAHWSGDTGDVVFRWDDMRAAADWQLEQVIEWIKECPNYDLDFHSECQRIIADLKRAMRPQQQEDNFS
jgi:hypothetical protein